MLHLRKIRELNLELPTSPGRPAHLSAASGLVQAGNRLYVVADDENQLGIFSTDPSVPGELLRLFPGTLPNSKKKRKAHKPDLEALCRLPPFGDYLHGALFALGSGSRRKRQRGVLLGLDVGGEVSEPPRIVDLSALFAEASKELSELNIEAAVVLEDRFRLLQRGNKGAGENACIDFDLSGILEALSHGDSLDAQPISVQRHDLGEVDGVPLCFSDATALPSGAMIFTAIAENTASSYDDGPCRGSAIGLMQDEELRWLEQLDEPLKVEGVSSRVEDDRVRLLMVTDADDASTPASLYYTEISL